MRQVRLSTELVFSASPFYLVHSGRTNYAVRHNPWDNKACDRISVSILLELFEHELASLV